MTEHEIIEDLTTRFAYRGQHKGRFALYTGGLSALEHAFSALGWDDPHYAPEYECQIKGCHKEATCGTNTKAGYKRVCTDHWRSERSKQSMESLGGKPKKEYEE